MLAIYNPLILSAIKAHSNKNVQFAHSCGGSTANMEEERTNAGKYLSDVLENDGNTFEILLNQWKLIEKKLLFVKLRLRLSGTQALSLSGSLRLTQALTQAHSGSYSVTVTVTQSLG